MNGGGSGFGILGSLRAWSDEGEIPLRGTKLRIVLAALCLDAGRVVSTSALRETLWDEDPPASAENAVQVYIASARKVVGTLGDPGAVIETAPHGYRLTLPHGMLDRDAFLTARADAAQAQASGLLESAAAHYRSALGVWRGAALGDLAEVAGLSPRAQELDRLELDTFEAFIENELTLGRHRETVVGLERRAGQNPLRESLWALLALALYRSDQQADALAALRSIRTHLADELGVEPGDRLATLEVGILRQDPALLTPALADEPAPHATTPSWPDRTATDVRSDLVATELRLELPDGRTVSVAKPRVTVGRDTVCDVVVSVPSVSGRHATITSTIHGHVIEDLLSTNGTYVNGEPVTRKALQPGDLIELGRVPVRYLRSVE